MAEGRRKNEALEPEDPRLSVAARHALHDEELIASYATDGDAAEEAERAQRLVERCVACRDLHADLVAIGATLRASGKAEVVALTRKAPRDFRLSVATANELRPGSVVLRLRDRIAAALSSFGRPMGMSLAALGVVGLLLGTVTFGGGAALAPAAGDAGTTAAGQAGEAPTEEPGELVAPTRQALETMRITEESAAPLANDGGGVASTAGGGSGGLAILLIAGSALLLVAGLGLLVLGSRSREPIRGD